MTYEPNFSTSAKMRISTKDLFRAGVTPDRVFAFMAYDRWGLAKLEAAGQNRSAAGATFRRTDLPGQLDGGMPRVDWKGLYKEDKLEGFAKINLPMPEDGFVSLIVKNADGQVVRNLLNAKFLTKGPQEVLWDGLTTPSDRKPGEPVPAGNYTWEAIGHKGIGLSLVGWACNAGRAPSIRLAAIGAATRATRPPWMQITSGSIWAGRAPRPARPWSAPISRARCSGATNGAVSEARPCRRLPGHCLRV